MTLQYKLSYHLPRFDKMSKKKQDLSVEEMKKALEIKITPREQKELQKMSWEDMISKAMKFNPNSKPKKKGKK